MTDDEKLAAREWAEGGIVPHPWPVDSPRKWLRDALDALEAERASYEPVHECCAEGTCPDPLYRRLRRD